MCVIFINAYDNYGIQHKIYKTKAFFECRICVIYISSPLFSQKHSCDLTVFNMYVIYNMVYKTVIGEKKRWKKNVTTALIQLNLLESKNRLSINQKIYEE